MNTPQDPTKGEIELIRRLQRELAADTGDEGATVGFGDDMAGLDPRDPTLLWSTDMLMDGTDFESAHHEWRAIGRKAMAVNLSDCAAMAAQPVSAICAVSLNNALSMDNALELLRGARDCAARFACPIVGGDTNSWDHPTVICISVAGRTESGQTPVCRDGARPGDRIYVSGRVGGSLLGRHMTFDPRIETALTINRQLCPHAMIDISDGLAIDLWRILEASGCGAEIEEAALDAIIHPDAVVLAGRDARSPRDHALHDGEDFELIVVGKPDASPGACERLGLLPLGRIVDSGFVLRQHNGSSQAIEPRGWEHFR